MSDIFTHNLTKRCKTPTGLVQGEPVSAARAAVILDRNQPIRKQERNELFPMRYAYPPFWITQYFKMNQ